MNGYDRTNIKRKETIRFNMMNDFEDLELSESGAKCVIASYIAIMGGLLLYVFW
jgi:hypothetical protein